MKKLIVALLLLASISVVGMEQEPENNTQETHPLITMVQNPNGPEPQQFEPVAGALKYNLDEKNYYFGNQQLPRIVLYNYLVCQECYEFAHCTITSPYIRELDQRDPEYVKRAINANIGACVGCLGSTALVAFLGL